MNKNYVWSISLLTALFCTPGCSAGVDSESGSKDEAPAGVSTAELTGWLGPISEEAGMNQRSYSQANIATTNAFCSGSYCDNNWIYGSPLPTGVFTGTENLTGVVISEEPPTNASFCVSSSGYLNGVVTGLRATGSYSDNLELICAPLSFSSGHYWNTCKWTNWFSEESGGYPTGWTSGYYAAGINCSGSRCDNVRYYICNFT
jgi:hypothetical protein